MLAACRFDTMAAGRFDTMDAGRFDTMDFVAFDFGFGFLAFSVVFDASAFFFLKGFREPVRNSSSESTAASLPMFVPVSSEGLTD